MVASSTYAGRLSASATSPTTSPDPSSKPAASDLSYTLVCDEPAIQSGAPSSGIVRVVWCMVLHELTDQAEAILMLNLGDLIRCRTDQSVDAHHVDEPQTQDEPGQENQSRPEQIRAVEIGHIPHGVRCGTVRQERPDVMHETRQKVVSKGSSG